jgi:predicted acetyltransferase
MPVSLVPAQPEDALRLRNLFQFYYYDFAAILGGSAGQEGCFGTPDLAAYWQDAWRYPLLVRAGEELAGFALVHQRSRITGDPGTWDVAEFFVLRHLRRRGVGTQAAVQMFDRFRGRWEVRQVRPNRAATDFWRTVISRYTRGQYSEALLNDDRWRGPVQAFDNSADGSTERSRAGRAAPRP